MRAILVCVDYADILAKTLPYNRHHFEQVMIVTNTKDTATEKIGVANGCLVYQTDAFYDNGAVFNKWKALEQGINLYGRDGILCIMDADVVWPKVIQQWRPERGKLYTPKRRMMERVPTPLQIPQECYWSDYPYHRQMVEWAGYTQIFHASDVVLKEMPWFEQDWMHAGGADSFFQARWNPDNKLRPPFDVLHIGEAGKNWCGRSTASVEDGSIPQKAEERRNQLKEFILGRTHGPDRFKGEKIKK